MAWRSIPRGTFGLSTANYNGNAGQLVKISPTSQSIASTYTNNGIDFPYAIAIDAPSTYSGHTGDIWVADVNDSDDSVFTSTGAAASFSPATAGSIEYSTAVAIDGNGYVWNASYIPTNASYTGGFLSKTAPAGTSGTSYTFASTDNIATLNIDGAGNVWVVNFDSQNQNDVAEVSNGGTLLTPAAGYIPIGGASGNPGNGPSSLAIDGSGNVWFVMNQDTYLHELVGVATPVATPIAYGTANNKLGTRL